MRGVGCSLEPSEGSGPMLDVELLAGGTMSQDITGVFAHGFRHFVLAVLVNTLCEG